MHSSNPCTVPSSPKGPWSTGKTTSTSGSPEPSATVTGSPSCRQTPSRPISISVTSWPAVRRPPDTEAPEASETSCSEERPPASTATRWALMPRGCGRSRWSWSLACVDVVFVDEVVVVVEEDEVCASLPTVMVTVLPFLAVELAAGLWEITTPFWLGVVTVAVRWVTLNPDALSALTAFAGGSPVTVGTETVVGAVPMVIVTGEPGAALVFPVGVWPITLPTSLCVGVDWLRCWTAKPARVRSSVAWVWLSPTTLGTFFWGCPEDTNSVTAVPRGTDRAVPGLVPVTWPCANRLELCDTTLPTLSPALRSTLVAWASVSPCTDGTDALPWPLDTVRVTVEPLSALVPAAGDSATTMPRARRLGTETVATWNLACSTVVRATLICSPVTLGTSTCLGRVRKYAAAAAAATSSTTSSTHPQILQPLRSWSSGGGRTAEISPEPLVVCSWACR